MVRRPVAALALLYPATIARPRAFVQIRCTCRGAPRSAALRLTRHSVRGCRSKLAAMSSVKVVTGLLVASLITNVYLLTTRSSGSSELAARSSAGAVHGERRGERWALSRETPAPGLPVSDPADRASLDPGAREREAALTAQLLKAQAALEEYRTHPRRRASRARPSVGSWSACRDQPHRDSSMRPSSGRSRAPPASCPVVPRGPQDPDTSHLRRRLIPVASGRVAP
jgi:hypothetical protein